MLFFMHFSHPVPAFLTPGFSSPTFSISYFCPITHHHALFPVFPAGESLYIMVSSWIWKPHSEVSVRKVWQQQSTSIKDRIKTVKCCVSVKGACYTLCTDTVCGWAGHSLMGDQKLLLRLWLLGILKFPLKVSLPSNYILRFISAFRQTAREAFGDGKKKKKKKLGSISLYFFIRFELVMKKKCWNGIKWEINCPFIFIFSL